jgi:ABC-type branched-subunit amino acid transport system substrate-binding protein
VKPGQSLGAAIEEARASPPATAEAEALCAEINDIAEAVDASGYGDRALGNRLLEAAARLRALGQPAAAQAWTTVTYDEATWSPDTKDVVLSEWREGSRNAGPAYLARLNCENGHLVIRWMPWPRQPDAQGGAP